VNDLSNIILFDGVCNLCNGFVQFVIKRDKKMVFRFASLQSESGQKILKPYLNTPQRQKNQSLNELTSVVYIKNSKLFSHSEAVILIVSELGGAWKWSKLLFVFPAFFRDFVYTVVAQNRYRIFGKQDECLLPQPELKDRFL